MKLFENGVGRPSNEVLRKRKIVTLSIITCVISLVTIIVGGITLLVSKSNNVSSLKGAASNTFTIVYDANGGNGSMPSQVITHGIKTRLRKNTFTKSGKKFEGWIAKRIVNGKQVYRGCTSSICSKFVWRELSLLNRLYYYKDEEKVSQTGNKGETVTMIAKWSGEDFLASNTTKQNTTKQSSSSSKSLNTSSSSKSIGNIIGSIFNGIFKGIELLFDIIKQIKPITRPTTREITDVITNKHDTANNNIKEVKNVNEYVCSFPFSSINCDKEANNAVKKIQEMLKTLGFYNSSIDGKYNAKTLQAVIDFQTKNNITPADGVVGYKEMLALAKHEEINAPYFIFNYEKGTNGTNTTIHGTSTIEENGISSIYQVVLIGIGDKISNTKITHKYGAEHIGYVASTKIGSDMYYRGCFSKPCTDESDDKNWVVRSKRDKNKHLFTYYYYDIGSEVIRTGNNGSIVNLTASYCDQLTNACKENFVYYNQNDYNQRFCGRTDGATIRSSGCGTTSMAMILSTLVDKKYGPVETMNEAYNAKKEYCGPRVSGTNDDYFEYSANLHNLSYKNLGSDIEEAKAVLERGGLIIANVDSSSPFTGGTHYIVIRRIDSKGNVYVADPNHPELFDTPYNFDSFVNKGWLYAKGLFAFEVK